MFEIRGKVTTAVCYAKTVADNAIEQIRTMCDSELTAGSRVRIMPDVHAGAGCTIGTTMTVHGRICPNIVGVDIGCGMYTLRLSGPEPDFRRIDEAAHAIPSGMRVWETRAEAFDLKELRCYGALRELSRRNARWAPSAAATISSKSTGLPTGDITWSFIPEAGTSESRSRRSTSGRRSAASPERTGFPWKAGKSSGPIRSRAGKPRLRRRSGN